MAWGCDGGATEKVTMDGVLLTQCPLRLFLDDTDDVNDIMWYYQAYKRGMLPVKGGLMDQPARMMAEFRIIDGAINTVENAKAAEAEAERKAAAARNKRPKR